MELEVGQVLVLRMRFNNNGAVSKTVHPYLIVGIQNNVGTEIIEIAQFNSLCGKEFKAAFKSNKTVICTDPDETVIDKDSYIQMDNKFTIEYFPELVDFRRQKDKLSERKLTEVIQAYNSYQQEHHLNEMKIVHISKDEIMTLN